VLHGRRLKGRWNLVRMNAARGGRSDKPQWLLIKSRDDTLRDKPPATRAMTRGRATSRHGAKQQGEPLPRFIVPQLATAVEAVPTDDGWLHEIKFDGYRIQARIDHGEVALRTRTAQDWTDRYPEVAMRSSSSTSRPRSSTVRSPSSDPTASRTSSCSRTPAAASTR
jgi:bifunctional non-homologous end joining protein LigD